MLEGTGDSRRFRFWYESFRTIGYEQDFVGEEGGIGGRVGRVFVISVRTPDSGWDIFGFWQFFSGVNWEGMVDL